MEELIKIYSKVRPVIEQRLREFSLIWEEKNDFRIFQEFAFCLLTPQSKAKVAWASITQMTEDRVLLKGTEEEIRPYLKGVRFYKNKAHYIVLARDTFLKGNKFALLDIIDPNNIQKTRDILVKTVKGYGYKEASHFLRNIGLGDKISILDRHIMRNMVRYGYLKEIPSSLTRRRYIEIEEKFFEFSKDSGIPPAHLDLLLWYREAGEVFK